MEKTERFEFNIPAVEDYYNVADYNDNFYKIDQAVQSAQNTQDLIDFAYANSNRYTEEKIAELVNGAPENLDTLHELAEAIAANATIMDALTEAIGKKAAQAELDTHTENTTIHITESERTKWNEKQDSILIDTALSTTSTNPLQNRVVAEEFTSINNKLSGCWIAFSDADGNPTTEPYIHWYEEDGT